MNRERKARPFRLPFSYRIHPSGVVIYDGKGERVLACPTEEEAVEAIDRMTKEMEEFDI